MSDNQEELRKSFAPRRMVHVRVIEDNGLYAAQCLEFDICAQGKTSVEAIQVWHKTAMGQILLDTKHGKEPLAAIPCAPISLWCGINRAEIVGIYLDELPLKALDHTQGDK